jgi:hypothetical protein
MEIINLFLILLIILSLCLIVIFLFSLILVIFDIIWFFKTKVPFGRSNIKLVREFLDKLDLENKIFIDLGSSDGSMVFRSDKKRSKRNRILNYSIFILFVFN